MNETPPTTQETEPREQPQEAKPVEQSSFPGIAETKAAAQEISASPPSPMPLPIAGRETPAESGNSSQSSPKSQYKGKDYKGRTFDPRLHRVKPDGSPDYNRDGTLKILPKSKQNLAEKVKSFFSSEPKSDHERDEEAQAAGEAQARMIADQEEMEASAFFLKEGYFMVGDFLAGPEFQNHDRENREKKVTSDFLRYEQATGRSFEPPPWLVLAVSLGADFKRTVAAVPECQEHFAEVRGAVAEKAVSGFLGNSWIGRTASKLMFWRKKPKKLDSVNEASAAFTRSRMNSEEGGRG